MSNSRAEGLNTPISCKSNHHVNNSFQMPLIITLKKTPRSTAKTQRILLSDNILRNICTLHTALPLS